jgi:hypothetical protein
LLIISPARVSVSGVDGEPFGTPRGTGDVVLDHVLRGVGHGCLRRLRWL